MTFTIDQLSNTVIRGDTFDVLPLFPDHCIDFIIADPPYNKSECDFDKLKIDIPNLTKEYNRIIKPNGCIAIFGIDLFSAKIMLENAKYYRYKWIWNKVFSANFVQFKTMPLRNYEEILIFYHNPPIYNIQMIERNSNRVNEHQKTNYHYLNEQNQSDSSLGIRKTRTSFLVDFKIQDLYGVM